MTRPAMRDVSEIKVRREDRPGRRPAEAPRMASRDPRAAGALAVLRFCARRRRPLGVVVVLVGATVAVATNALTNQPGRHPAPLFAPPAERQAAAPRAPAAAAPPALAAPDQASAAPIPPKRDPIGDLIRGEAGTTASTGPKADPDVRLAQRALAKLGYGAIKADGLMGAETRAAIERFERDRKLPRTGEAAGRTLRELAQRAESEPRGRSLN